MNNNCVKFYIVRCVACKGEYLGVRNTYTCKLCRAFGSSIVKFKECELRLENGLFNIYEEKE